MYTSETEVIQTDLQCATIYNITVRVMGVASLGVLVNNRVQVLVEGKVTVSVAYKFCTISYSR